MRILLVEDDDLIREFLEVCLIDEDFDVDCASSVDAALHLMKSQPCPDLMVTDYNLASDLTGIDLATELRRCCITVPVLVITGRPDLVRKDRSAPEGVDVLAKPFSITSLLAAIDKSTRH